jgi:hypothetical protein
MKKIKFHRRLPLDTLAVLILLCVSSCSGYENPGNNSGKTGDGTGADSLQAKKSDTGKGANMLNKEVNSQNDSAREKRENRKEN